jgi:hypothetical protein
VKRVYMTHVYTSRSNLTFGFRLFQLDHRNDLQNVTAAIGHQIGRPKDYIRDCILFTVPQHEVSYPVSYCLRTLYDELAQEYLVTII